MSSESTAEPAHSSIIAARIALTAERRGLSIRRLAATAGLPYKTVQNYLSGRHRIPAGALARLAAALDVSADWLVFGQAATFNKEALVDALEIVADLRAFAKAGQGATPQEESGALFEKYYSKFYQEYLGPRDRSDAPSRHAARPGGPSRR